MQTYIFDFDGTRADSGATGVKATQAALQAERPDYLFHMPADILQV